MLMPGAVASAYSVVQARQVLWVSNSFSEDVGSEAGRACGHVIRGSLATQRAPEVRGTARTTGYSPRSAEGGRDWSDIRQWTASPQPSESTFIMLPHCHTGGPTVLLRTSQ